MTDPLTNISELAWDAGMAEAFANIAAKEVRSGTASVALASASRIALPGQDQGSAPSPDRPLRRLGRYVLGVEIARGGVGIVHRARDLDLGRDVAIKLLKAPYQDHPELLERFFCEAQIGAQLQHPGILPIYDFGIDAEDRPYMAMKLIVGQTLERAIAQRSHPADDRARYLDVLMRVCETLAHAHERGVIHRDLKPGNVIVGAFGEVQVLDWGFAKVLDIPVQNDASSAVCTVRSERADGEASTLAVLGTPAYMPPEQARGDRDVLDRRADVFALGAILCEILTGSAPYRSADGDLLEQARSARLEGAQRRLGEEPDAELRAIASTCLAADPLERPADASAVLALLRSHRDGVESRLAAATLESAEARGHARQERRTRRLQLILAAVLLLVTIGSGAYYVARDREQRAHETALRDAVRNVTALVDSEQWSAALGAIDGASLVTRTESSREFEASLTALRQQAEAGWISELLRDARSTPLSEPDEADATYQARLQRVGLDPFRDGAAVVARVNALGSSTTRSVELAFSDWAARKRRRGGAASEIATLSELADRCDPNSERVPLRGRFLAEDLTYLLAESRTLDPVTTDPATADLLAVMLAALGRTDEAHSLLERSFRVHAGDFWINAHLAELSLESPATDGVRHDWIAALSPGAGPRAWEALIRRCLEDGDDQAAHAAAQRARFRFVDHPEFEDLLRRTRERLGLEPRKPERAGPGRGRRPPHPLDGPTRFPDRGQWERAEADYRAGRVDSDRATELAGWRLALGDPKGAEDLVRFVLASSPEDQRAHEILVACLCELGRIDAARSHLEERPAGRRSPALLRAQARIERATRALEQLRESADIPTEPRLLLGQAQAACSTGRFALATERFRLLVDRPGTLPPGPSDVQRVAVAAALSSGLGLGVDAPSSEAERAAHRRLALQWADRAARRLEERRTPDGSRDAPPDHERLDPPDAWLLDRRLESARGDLVPDGERSEWARLWLRFEALASEEPPPR